MALRLGLCQMLVTRDKSQNLVTARRLVNQAASLGASLISLPECFNAPYAVEEFAAYAEIVPEVGHEVTNEAHPTTRALLDLAKEHKVFLVGGSIPERDKVSGKLFNTCVVANPMGEMIAKHRKMHLFDVDIPNGIRFMESETLSPGSRLTMFETPWCLVGIGICYDMRFPEMAMLMRERGCKLLIYPGAFNLTTGPAHWELLQRARAVDNQLFVATVSPARNPESNYKAWGHSSIISPWGEVLKTTEHDEAVIVSEDLDLDHCDRVRKSVPISKQTRSDLYCKVKWIGDNDTANEAKKKRTQ